MSEIRANTVSNAAGTGPATLTGQSAAKAWVNFNGTGTIAARDSFNFSSLTDNGTGDYTVNLTTAMSNTTYTLSGASGDNGVDVGFRSYGSFPPTTSAVRVASTAHTGSLTDSIAVTPILHGDLA